MPDEITDAFMLGMLEKSRQYCVVLLTPTAAYDPNAAKDSAQCRTSWAHARRNFELRAAGKMPLVGPILAPPYVGLAVFAVPAEEVAEIMEEDPAVKAGLFTFEIMPWRSFPGDALPA